MRDPEMMAALLQEQINIKSAKLRRIISTADSASEITRNVVRTTLPVAAGAVAASQVRKNAAAANARDATSPHDARISTHAHTDHQHIAPNSVAHGMAYPDAGSTMIEAPFDCTTAMTSSQICDTSPDGNLFNVAALMQSIKDRESVGSGDYLAINTQATLDEPALGAYQFLPSTAWEQLDGTVDLSGFRKGEYVAKGWMNPAFQNWFLKNPGAQDFAALRYIHAGVKCGAKTPDQIGAWWLGGFAGLERPTLVSDSNGTTPAVHGKNILASYDIHASEQRFSLTPNLSKHLHGLTDVHDGTLDSGTASDQVGHAHGVLGDMIAKLHDHLT